MLEASRHVEEIEARSVKVRPVIERLLILGFTLSSRSTWVPPAGMTPEQAARTFKLATMDTLNDADDTAGS